MFENIVKKYNCEVVPYMRTMDMDELFIMSDGKFGKKGEKGDFDAEVAVLVVECAECEHTLAMYFCDGYTGEITESTPFYETTRFDHHVVHSMYQERQHSWYVIADEYDAGWDYENDQPLNPHI